MSESSRSAVFHVITPTFRRSSVLRRFISALRKQSYPDWTGYVIHDGPNATFQQDYCGRPSPDARIHFSLTEKRTGDMGNSQRMQALHAAAAHAGPYDYCVLWDDDNYFFPHALASIAETLELTGFPDLLLVPLKVRGGVLPPPDKPVSNLDLGDVDAGCLVLRAACYDSIRQRLTEVEDCYLFEIEVFRAVRAGGGAVVSAYAMAPVGEYDGLHYPQVLVSRPRAQWFLYWRRVGKALEKIFVRGAAVGKA